MQLADYMKSTTLPSRPFFVFRPHMLQKSAHYFKTHFQGKILYAVKTNPELTVLTALYNAGIQAFEAASLSEIKHIREHFPRAECYFMHPIKSRSDIRIAYFDYGIRHFALDSGVELSKILAETDHAKDLFLHVRLSIPNTYAEHSLANKFGTNMLNAPSLLKKVREKALQLGLCFHVGSQCMHPDAYRIAIRMTRDLIHSLNFKIEMLNIGGGFPSVYPGMNPPPLDQYFSAIHEEFEVLSSRQSIQLFAEPGRALVAESTSLIAQVLLRKDDALYINDGIYGALFDAGFPKLIYPVQLIRSTPIDTKNLTAYRLYGPTCDALDEMRGPFYLPNDIKEGDYIEIGQLGAYGRTLTTQFNGFTHHEETIVIDDDPLMTLYDTSAISRKPLEVIAA